MGWEHRGVHRYYYRSVRHGRQVTKAYCGTGPLAALLAAEDADEREAQRAQDEAWRQERTALEALDQQLDTWWEASTVLLKATLYAEGYYQHDRGEWRKRADDTDEGVDASAGEGDKGR